MSGQTKEGYICPDCNNWNAKKNLPCGNCGWNPKGRGASLKGKAMKAVMGKGELTFFKGLLLILAFLSFIALIILSFMALVSIYWLGSLLMTLAILFLLKPWRGHKGEGWSGGVVLIACVFTALMGIAIDQGGNPLQNLVVEKIQCEKGAHLTQAQETYHIRPGETIYTREFFCVDQNGAIQRVGTGTLLFIRLTWYILLFYLLYGVKFLYPSKS